MPNEAVLVLYFIMWYLLVGLAILFIISGLDDLFIDVYYWTRFVIRLARQRFFSPLTYQKLASVEEQMIAVLIPCWHEANVIGTMLRHNCYSIDYKNYYLFVGVYPNDPHTVEEVQSLAKIIKNVQCVVGAQPGPTNKAANLNQIYNHLKVFEKDLEKPFNIIVFHDSEDIIHPLSFKLYNYLIPRKDMIQIPIFPLEVSYWNFTHWLYADEFTENHTKDILVRESIHAHVPSAGVGTAFARSALQLLENPRTGEPFSIDSLTEDYRTSLALRVHNLKQIFVVQQIRHLQWKKHWFFKHRYVQKLVYEYVATRAMFPTQYSKAVRQKARWIIGIVFQEWYNSNWPESWAVRYTLAHDRKSFITHFINGFGYFLFLSWIIYSLFTFSNPAYPSLQEQFNLHPWVWWLVWAVTCIMIERMIQRVIAVKRVYSWIPALLSIPRAFYGNILNLHALIRAYQTYYAAPKETTTTSKQPAWDKTDHEFPGRHVLVPFRRRLGDLLLENNTITQEQLDLALQKQRESGKRLGKILCDLKLINPQELLNLLSKQYQLPIFPKSELAIAQKQIMGKWPLKKMQWLKREGITLLEVDEEIKTLTLGIDDPTNELQLTEVIDYIKPYKSKFMLLNSNE